VGQLVGTYAGAHMSSFGASLAGGLTSGLIRSAIYNKGKVDYASIAADAFGNAVGNSVVEGNRPESQGTFNGLRVPRDQAAVFGPSFASEQEGDWRPRNYSLLDEGAPLPRLNAGSAPDNNPAQMATPWDRQAFEQAFINSFAGSARNTYELPYEALAANGAAVPLVRRQSPATPADVRRIDNEIAARTSAVSEATSTSVQGSTWELEGFGSFALPVSNGPTGGFLRGVFGAPRSVMEGPAPWTENAGRIFGGLWDSTIGGLFDIPRQYYDIYGALRYGPSAHQPASQLGQAANTMSPGELGAAVLQSTLGAPSNLVIDALDGNWRGVGSNIFGTVALAGGYAAGIRGLQTPSFGSRYYQPFVTENAQDFVGGLTRGDRMALGVRYERTQGLIDSVGQYGGQSASQVYMRAFDANGNLMPGSVRLDRVGLRADGGFDVIDYKLSLRSPLTDNQALHFPNFELYGGVVTGLRAERIGLPQGRIMAPFRVDLRTGPLPTKPGG
jgi:hypothetical protein